MAASSPPVRPGVRDRNRADRVHGLVTLLVVGLILPLMA